MALNQSAEAQPVGHGPPKAVFLIILLVVAGAGFFIWRAVQPHNTNELSVSGRIEGYETNIGAKIGGRVDYIAAREGDVVEKGQLIVRLSDEDIQAQQRGAEARLEKAKEAKDQADDQIKVIQSQIKEAKLNEQQSTEDAAGRIWQAEANVSTAKAQLNEAQAQLTQAKADRNLAAIRKERYHALAQDRAVSQDQDDQASANLETADANVSAKQAAVAAARKQLVASEALFVQAKTTRLNPHIRQAQLVALQRQLIQAQSQLRAAQHDIKNAAADVDQVKANIQYLNITSPITAIVTARTVEPGAVVTAGQTVLSIIDLDTVYLRGYVPEGEIERVRVGEKAEVVLDSFKKTKKTYDGTVIEVDPEASFTPENIYFKDDRVKQVFGIKIGIKDPQRFPKPGMPADAKILVDKPN